MTRTINAAGRLDRLPISRFHWKILGLIAGGAFLDAFDIYLANGAVASMVKEGFTDLRHGAIFVSSTFIGMMIGAFAAGYLGDRLGRRYSYQLNLAVFGLASLAACFAPNIEWLIVLRLVMGIGLGAELVVAAGTLAEFVPPATRGKWVSLLAVITNSGLFAALAAGYWIIPHLGWRYMFALAGIGALVVWFLRKRMPESPRWLESVGRLDEAEATLASIEQQVRAQHGELPPVERAVSLNVGKVPISRLFAPDMRARLLVAALTAIGVNVGLYGFVAWLPTFFVAEGLSVVKSLGFVFFMSIGSPVGGLIGYVVADRWGRARSIVVASLISIALGWIYVTLRDATAIVMVGFGLVSALYTITTLGLFGYIPELFPTEVRLRGTGVAGTAGRASSIVTPYLALLLYQRFGVSGVISMVSLVLVVLCVAIVVLRVETSRQALEDIAPGDAADGSAAQAAAVAGSADGR
ncbi:MFS transporter [Burkholderia gladioli]|jgi:putative MFS transporter|uniref:MFS transporter n=1 Tax=Burkholderia gladioli TaxID=28095 RepID=UPI000626EEF6|nr:MFS transporter [Burkholderia gladioli]KAF1065137.1 Inner membrane metabolite transport protein YdjE [Burkholderia gladioli]KKJ07473.1 MFS transporter [Burkholderia gladioli]MBJ9678468.1 MFS transporter [Burkholderia gladioli]MBU9179961.1 MFS transporter [Burkholderia gladioli]MBU9323490.1 MFS transporter [Burkholderia gladioli]